MTAEKYHLKWDAHLSYLNSTLSNLYKNEKFADVVLYTSSNNGIGGLGTGISNSLIGISAHKVILSSYSQFFAAMFDNTPSSALASGMLYVVLPADVSHRAVKILVQYMYSGEATVSHDILNEVLRGGEILKIRGLYRSQSSSNYQHNQKDPTECSIGYAYGKDNKRNVITSSQLPNVHTNDMYSINKYSLKENSLRTRFLGQSKQHSQLCDLSDSIMPKDSPVTVRSPKIAQRSMLPSSIKHQIGKRSDRNSGISVNKEVAIDPEHNCYYPMDMREPLQSVISGVPVIKEIDFTNCSITSETQDLCHRQRGECNEYLASPQMAVEDQEEEYMKQQHEDNSCHDGELVSLTSFELKLPHRSENEYSYFLTDEQCMDSTRSTSPINQTHTFMSIKEEPADWSACSITEASTENNRHSTLQASPKHKCSLYDTTVKLEIGSSLNPDPVNAEGTNDYDIHTPLICNICRKSFSDHKMWICHIEAHAKSSVGTVAIQNSAGKNQNLSSNISSSQEVNPLKPHVPKKRQKVSENDVDHVTLLCDVCSTLFETPAEWVRHINNQHTEVELALFNNDKKDHQQSIDINCLPSTTTSVSQQQLITSQKKCSCILPSEEPIKRACFVSHKNATAYRKSRGSHEEDINRNLNTSGSTTISSAEVNCARSGNLQ